MFQKDLTMLSVTVGVFFINLLLDLINIKCHKDDTLKKEDKRKSIKAFCNW